jgi:hypothetical protein
MRAPTRGPVAASATILSSRDGHSALWISLEVERRGRDKRKRKRKRGSPSQLHAG